MEGRQLLQYIIDISEITLAKKQEATEYLAQLERRPTPRALDLANRRVPESDCDHRTPGVMCDFCNPPSQ